MNENDEGFSQSEKPLHQGTRRLPPHWLQYSVRVLRDLPFTVHSPATGGGDLTRAVTVAAPAWQPGGQAGTRVRLMFTAEHTQPYGRAT